jgi:tRNA (mo5U34)-methyltransferase
MLHTLSPLRAFRSSIANAALAPSIRTSWLKVSRYPHWAPLAKQISELNKLPSPSATLDAHGESIVIGEPHQLTPNKLERLCRELVPWRIGPYQLGSLYIDSEWQSQRKWERIKPLLGPLRGKRVADVGCSNGYFLFKLSALEPEVAVGFDPIERCWLQFALLQALAKVPSLAFVPAGISDIETFPSFFDLILCMGVIYHQRDPFTACKKLFAAVRPGGRVILESLVIPNSGSYLLVPNERYAKMRNAWIIPTAEALSNLLSRAGFSSPEIHSFGPVTTSEQRRTMWAPYESLADFLDPADPTKTIEGYPAPHSALVIATRT